MLIGTVVAEWGRVARIVLVVVEAAQDVGAEVRVPKHSDETFRFDSVQFSSLVTQLLTAGAVLCLVLSSVQTGYCHS